MVELAYGAVEGAGRSCGQSLSAADDAAERCADRGKRRFRVCTTESNHTLPIAPNLLASNFTVAAANTVWAGDLTYISTREGWLYLAVVLGRVIGDWVCNSSSQSGCSGGTKLYGNSTTWVGLNMTQSCDTTNNQCQNQGYDEFSRLASLTATSFYGQGNYSFTYDRWGNRLSQTSSSAGPSPNAGVNSANNQIVGYSYDAAGNLTNDGQLHSFTYDAEGNVLQVNGGSSGSYVYDALNHRVRVQTSSSTNEYLFDPFGRRTSTWVTSSNFGNEGRIYWDGKQIAFRAQNGQTFFEHQSVLGTERLRTNYSGAIATTESSLGFGDGLAKNVVNPYSDQDNNQYAGQESDAESFSQHAQFRQYSSTLGRFMSPDPYDGSYDVTNPQSLNRYSYVFNNPYSYKDPSGLNAGDIHFDADGNQYLELEDGSLISYNGGGSVTVYSDSGGGYIASFGEGQGQYPTGGSGTVGAAPSSAIAQRFACASKFGQAHSLGAALGGGTVANFLGGNAVSSLANLGLAATGNGPSPDPLKVYASGSYLGVPVNDALRLAGKNPLPGVGSVSGAIRTAGIRGFWNAATDVGSISSIAAEGGEIAVQGGLGAAEVASGVAVAKFGIDALTVLYGGIIACAK